MPLSSYRQFEPALAYAAEATERTMDRLLPKGDSGEARVFEAMRYSSLGGGKRLRAFFVLASATLFRVSATAALRVASAIEFVHAYSLIHDDLPAMDDDDLRRGKPSCHKQFDEATAILAGDALQALAFEVLAQEPTHGDPAVRVALVSELARASGAQGMVGGQMLDLLAETEPNLSIGAITRLQRPSHCGLRSRLMRTILGWRSRSSTTCSMSRAIRPNSARRPTRTPTRARPHSCRFSAWSGPGRRRPCLRNRPLVI
jgi:farnesyl diphosphate synthase